MAINHVRDVHVIIYIYMYIYIYIHQPQLMPNRAMIRTNMVLASPSGQRRIFKLGRMFEIMADDHEKHSAK